MLPHPLSLAQLLHTPPTLCHPICPVSPACHSQDHAGRWRVVAVPRCPPLRLHSPSAPHLKVPSPSLLEMAPVNTFGFFSLAILLRVLGQFPQAENNYPLSITGALWDLYLRKKSQFCWLPTPMSLPHYLSRQECKHFSGSDPPPPMLVWVIAVHEVSFSGTTAAICLLPAFSLGNMTLTHVCIVNGICAALWCPVVLLSSETSHIAEPYYYSTVNIWDWIHTDLTQISLSFFYFQSKSHKSVSMAIVCPLGWGFLLRTNYALRLIPGFLSIFFSLFPSLALLLLSCRAVGWVEGGRTRRGGVDIVSLLESVLQSQIIPLASFPSYFQVVRLIHSLLIAVWKDPEAM